METDTIYTNYSQNEILLVFGCQSEYRKLQEVINLCLSYKFDIVYEDGAVGGRTRGGEILFEFGLCNFRFDRKKNIYIEVVLYCFCTEQHRGQIQIFGLENKVFVVVINLYQLRRNIFHWQNL